MLSSSLLLLSYGSSLGERAILGVLRHKVVNLAKSRGRSVLVGYLYIRHSMV